MELVVRPLHQLSPSLASTPRRPCSATMADVHHDEPAPEFKEDVGTEVEFPFPFFCEVLWIWARFQLGKVL